MDEHFDLANVGRTNQLHVQNETNIIHRQHQSLENIEREPVSAQLLEEKESIKEDLIRFEIALSPHKLLPNEILGEIFILLSLDYGPVALPIPTNKTPQLLLSHVCSRWRTVALRIPELWNNTVTCVPNSFRSHSEVLDSFNRSVQLNQQWILRAGDIPVALSLHLYHPCDGVLEGILSPIKVKKLHLDLFEFQVTELCGLPDTALPDLEELSLTLGLYYYECNFDKPFFTRLHSVTFSDVDNDGYLNDLPGFFEQLSLPWHQLQCFGFLFTLDCFILPIIIDFLRQMPNLRQLICDIDPFGTRPILPTLSLSNLQNLTLRMIDGYPERCSEVIRSFAFPALTRFVLDLPRSWTPETLKAIKQQHNLDRLQEFVLIVRDKEPAKLLASSILENAPMLRSLQLPECAIMDTEAIAGLSNGTLGRFLRKLHIKRVSDPTEIIKMAEKRKEVVDELIKDGCSWREKITVLREIIICDSVKDDDERVVALKKAGITITGKDVLPRFDHFHSLRHDDVLYYDRDLYL
ncbi:hypothetical protein F5887DRAFT_609824 [Amanita rubescens]|nr:hypothetical protein F5887DRAFT_609824 [Amanita rubescens]